MTFGINPSISLPQHNTVTQERPFDKIDASILLGNVLDHFDNALYGFLAPLLAPLFFPDADPIVQLIMAYSVLGTSLITRPLGAFIFGNVARRFGPLTGLSYSLIGVAVTNIIFGCLPTYEKIGCAATILLIGLRLVRGIFSAGECAISKLYIINGKHNRTAFRASYIYPMSSMAGMMLASGSSVFVLGFQENQDLWRLCFLGGGVTGLVGYALRLWGKSQNQSIQIFEQFQVASLKLLWTHRIPVLQVALTTGFSHITAAIPFVLLNTLIPLVTPGITLQEMMRFNTALLIFDFALIPLCGHLLERFSIIKIMTFSCILLALSVPVLMFFMVGASLAYVTTVRVWIVVLGVIFLCPQHLYYQRLFPERNEDKYFVVGMANALGAATIGRLTPVLWLWLWHMTHDMGIIGLYVSCVAGVNLILLYKNKPDQ